MKLIMSAIKDLVPDRKQGMKGALCGRKFLESQSLGFDEMKTNHVQIARDLIFHTIHMADKFVDN